MTEETKKTEVSERITCALFLTYPSGTTYKMATFFDMSDVFILIKYAWWLHIEDGRIITVVDDWRGWAK